MEGLRDTTFETDEQRIAWEGLASSCASPVRRLVAFMAVGFTFFVALVTTVILFYNLFGERTLPGQGVPVPDTAFHATLALSAALVCGGYVFWLARSLHAYRGFASLLRRGGLDPRRPTRDGLIAYSDHQLLALRARFERLAEGGKRRFFGRVFGFRSDDSFSLGPLSALPDTFEMNAMRVEWETNLILASKEPMPEVSWWTEGRLGVLPRQPDEVRKLFFALTYTGESVRMLKRRYGYRTERWHLTVPDGELWNAVRDQEQAKRIQATLNRRMRG